MQPEGPFCQCCAMPMSNSERFGSEVDGSKNDKYCSYCYKDGAFTMPDVTVDEMAEISAKGWSDGDSNMSFEEAKAFLSKCLPQLERWRI